MEKLPIKRALLSVTDKTGLLPFATFLAEHNVELISTGGTCSTLREAGLKVTQVSEITGFPEIMGGRVKTLHPHIHGGILADKDNNEHVKEIERLAIAPIDLVCVNLYNFSEAVKKQLDLTQAIEQIDIGGPCMLRAAAKNFSSVAVVSSPSWYDKVITELKAHAMTISLELRLQLSCAAFEATSKYDQMIFTYLQKSSASA